MKKGIISSKTIAYLLEIIYIDIYIDSKVSKRITKYNFVLQKYFLQHPYTLQLKTEIHEIWVKVHYSFVFYAFF